MNFLGLSGKVSILFEFEPSNRPTATLSRNQEKGGSQHPESLAIFSASEPIVGIVTILLAPRKQVEHLGIKAEAICRIGSHGDKNSSCKLSAMVKELDTPGILEGNKKYKVEFSPADVAYESYDGLKVRLRHFLCISITQNFGVTTKEFDFIVRDVIPLISPNPSLKVEVGIEDCLHIEFEYDKSKYHLEDVVIGKIYFQLVRIKIKCLELGIIQREIYGHESTLQTHSNTIVKYEVMEGSPTKGECIPLRIFLKPYNLTPTYNEVYNKFSVKYFLNLVLVDEENRRYFKQQEVILYRHKLV